MTEDLADKVDDFICAWDKVVGTDLDTLVVLLLGRVSLSVLQLKLMVCELKDGWVLEGSSSQCPT